MRIHAGRSGRGVPHRLDVRIRATWTMERITPEGRDQLAAQQASASTICPSTLILALSQVPSSEGALYREKPRMMRGFSHVWTWSIRRSTMSVLFGTTVMPSGVTVKPRAGPERARYRCRQWQFPGEHHVLVKNRLVHAGAAVDDYTVEQHRNEQHNLCPPSGYAHWGRARSSGRACAAGDE